MTFYEMLAQVIELFQRQGQCDSACHLLVEVHGWCTEGFITADLQGARV